MGMRPRWTSRGIDQVSPLRPFDHIPVPKHRLITAAHAEVGERNAQERGAHLVLAKHLHPELHFMGRGVDMPTRQGAQRKAIGMLRSTCDTNSPVLPEAGAECRAHLSRCVAAPARQNAAPELSADLGASIANFGCMSIFLTLRSPAASPLLLKQRRCSERAGLRASTPRPRWNRPTAARLRRRLARRNP